MGEGKVGGFFALRLLWLCLFSQALAAPSRGLHLGRAPSYLRVFCWSDVNATPFVRNALGHLNCRITRKLGEKVLRDLPSSHLLRVFRFAPAIDSPGSLLLEPEAQIIKPEYGKSPTFPVSLEGRDGWNSGWAPSPSLPKNSGGSADFSTVALHRKCILLPLQ